MAMVLMQQSEARVPKVKSFRSKLTAIVSDKHQSTMTKMGAIMASGILEAGGRNVTISMQSRAGFTKMSSIVGLAVWCQYWYWYPFMHFLPLAFTPTMHIGLNKDFKMPNKYVATCDSRPSQFAYPKKLEEKKEEKKERVTTVTLSTTAKAKAREARKELSSRKDEADSGGAAAESSGSADMDVQEGEEATEGVEESKGGESGTAAHLDADLTGKDKAQSEKEEGSKEDGAKTNRKEPEPTSFKIKNPSRVTGTQEPFVDFDMNQRYVLRDFAPASLHTQICMGGLPVLWNIVVDVCYVVITPREGNIFNLSSCLVRRRFDSENQAMRWAMHQLLYVQFF